MLIEKNGVVHLAVASSHLNEPDFEFTEIPIDTLIFVRLSDNTIVQCPTAMKLCDLELAAIGEIPVTVSAQLCNQFRDTTNIVFCLRTRKLFRKPKKFQAKVRAWSIGSSSPRIEETAVNKTVERLIEDLADRIHYLFSVNSTDFVEILTEPEGRLLFKPGETLLVVFNRLINHFNQSN